MHYEEILFAVEEGVATITLNRPDRLNAWTDRMGREVKSAIRRCSDDDAVRAILITGAGRGFCSGADMGVLQDATQGRASGGDSSVYGDSLREPDEDPGLPLGEAFDGRWSYFIKCRKPIIAAINGPAAGLGLIIALYCDIRFAARSAKFTTAFAQRGLIAEHGIAWILPRLIGPGNALDILLSGRKFLAEEAGRMGLVNAVLDDDALLAGARDYARTLAASASPRSMGIMKAQIWRSLMESYNDCLAVADAEMMKSFSSEDFKEGVAHFIERRAPRFTGK